MTDGNGKNVGSGKPSPDRETSHDNSCVSDQESPVGTGFPDADGKDHGASEAWLEEDDPKSEEDFDPAQCLFCNRIHSSLDDNLAHMLKMHGLFIPDKDHLVVDVETLTAYLHLIIFAYFQCLYCGTERSSTEAVQQHMMGKGHCKFDISSKESEFCDFYDFGFDHEDDEEENEAGGIPAKRSSVPIVQPDDTSLRLPSGKILSHRPARQPRSQQNKPRPNADITGPRLGSIPPVSSPPTSDSAPTHSTSSALTKAEKRGAALSNQLVQLRADDRRSLMHMPTSQQRALLATQKKQMDKVRKAERTMQSRVEGMGNKALMKHFVPDTPGRLNG